MGTTSVEEYLRLFRAKAEQMGEFPDKNIISGLTGTATRHKDDMSQHIVALLESMICDPNHPAKHKLPLCYLVDSIVKNTTDPYADLFENGLVRWFCSAYDAVDGTSKKHLARVVATWEVQSVFRAEKRKEIQRYMLTGPQSVAPSPTTTTISINPPLPPQAHIPASAPALPPSLVPAPSLAASTLPLPPLPPPPPPPLMAVAPAPTPVAVPVPAVPPDVQGMINSRMTQLLDQQLRELGESSTMTVDDLWRTNAELAGGFRLVAQAQVHEELGLPPPPPPPTVSLPPAPQALPPPQQPPPPLPLPTQPPPPQPQLAIQLPLRVPTQSPGAVPASTPPPWAAKAPPSQDLGRAVQLANEVAANARGALDASIRGDTAGGRVQAAEAAGKAALLACLLGGDAAGDGPAVMHLTGLAPWDVRALARSNPGVVRKLYGEGFPFWCKQDGTRFRAQAQLDAHMDLLFRRKRARREQKGNSSREWYCTGEQWMTDFGRLGPPPTGSGDGAGDGAANGAGGDGADENGGTDSVDGDPDGADAVVPADERFTKCRICGDRFDMFYDNEVEEWMYRNACYLTVSGVSDGDEEEDEDGDGDAAEGGEGEEGGGVGGDGGTRQIIVHKLCLDVSGLRDREEIAWRDLMPGTPRQRKRPADDAGLDSGAEEDGGGEEGGWGEGSSALNGGVDYEGESDGAAENRGMSESDGTAKEDGPPLKRVKAEEGTNEINGGARGEEDGGNAKSNVEGGEGAADVDDD